MVYSSCWCYYCCYLANLYVYIWHWFIPIWKKNDIIILAFYTLLMPLELYPSNVFVMILLLSFVIITWQYISFITYLATAAKICPYLELCWVQVSMWDSYTNIETIVQEIIDRWNIIFSFELQFWIHKPIFVYKNEIH